LHQQKLKTNKTPTKLYAPVPEISLVSRKMVGMDWMEEGQEKKASSWQQDGGRKP